MLSASQLHRPKSQSLPAFKRHLKTYHFQSPCPVDQFSTHPAMRPESQKPDLTDFGAIIQIFHLLAYLLYMCSPEALWPEVNDFLVICQHC